KCELCYPGRGLPCGPLAGGADAADLDYLAVDLEAERAAMTADRGDDGLVVQLLGQPAVAADHELALMRVIGIETCDEGVERFDAMDEFLSEEKIDRAIDRRRHRLAGELSEQPVGADRLPGFEDQREDPATRLGQAHAALAA